MVLALVLFALGGPLPASQVGASAAVAASMAQVQAGPLCGGGWGDPLTAHAPCHACRSAVPALPPVRCDSVPAFRDWIDVRFEAVAQVEPGDLPAPRPLSRGPPLAG